MNNLRLKSRFKNFTKKSIKKLTYNLIGVKNLPIGVPNVSIIIPVNNSQIYLKQCLDSIVFQTLKNIEIICINDGSEDNSLKILEKYAKKDSRVKIINQKNQGQGNARNKGLNIAKGTYIGFIDSDDWVDLNYFEELYKYALNNNAEIAATKNVILWYSPENKMNCYIGLNQSKKILTTLAQKSEIIETTGITWNKIYKREFLLKNNIKCCEVRSPAEDNYFTIWSIIHANKIAVVESSSYYYRQSNVNALTKLEKTQKDFVIIEVYKEIKNTLKELNLTNKDKWNKVIDRRIYTDLKEFYKSIKNKYKPAFKTKIKNEFPDIFFDYSDWDLITNHKFQKIPVRKNSVLVSEINWEHGEVMPGYIKYLLDLGFHVDVLITDTKIQEKPFPMFSNKDINLFVSDLANLKEILQSEIIKKYDYLFLTSELAYYVKQNGRYQCIFEYIPHMTKPNKKTIVVKHSCENPTIAKNRKLEVITLADINNSIINSKNVVNSHYFGEIYQKEKGKIINFVVAGAIQTKRKNHTILINAVSELDAKKINNFKITVIGRGKVDNIPQNLQKYFHIKGRIDYTQMYEDIKKSDFFLCLLDPDNPEHDWYINTGTSGSFQLIYGFLKPCLIAEKFTSIPRLNNKNAIIYKNNSNLSKAMMEAIELPQEEYLLMQKNLAGLSDDIQKKSLNNLKQILNKNIT